jgi:hypothetical protein
LVHDQGQDAAAAAVCFIFVWKRERNCKYSKEEKKKKIENWCFQCAKNQENQPNKDAGHLFLYNIFRGVRGRAKDMHTI